MTTKCVSVFNPDFCLIELAIKLKMFAESIVI